MSELTVNREQLVELLKAKRDDLSSVYDDMIAKQEARVEMATNPGAEVIAWYEEIIFPRFREGTVTYEAGSKMWAPKPGTPVVPPRPAALNRADEESSLARLKKRRLESLRLYDSAIQMLEITVTETVEIGSSEYERLLNQNVAADIW